ncbi:LysM domain-containing protein [Paenibacillus sp. UNCCL117]|uniref:LysM peptidoglycan-binding domain-containing protein n=1 Tax=unclassified Paenibacillus TaxID=185978 RepID=UPI00088BF107|nr:MULTISPECIES: LysM peptidoglycan-binding domain-containing protein [unclassified Paenibacillus]SDC46366.1 LysM domain-containing protein [Paenibacillus sp. cl123]SFW12317.1 LysM domain-containing protein [Paenibacillus sp. UNCCL117]
MIQTIPFHSEARSAAGSRAAHRSNGHAGRLVVIAAVLVALLVGSGAIMLFAGDSDVYAADMQPVNHPAIVVSSGESLWTIAAVYKSSDETIKEYIYKIKKLNGLKESSLRSGQKLLLP